jgi:hypothetical protein
MRSKWVLRCDKRCEQRHTAQRTRDHELQTPSRSALLLVLLLQARTSCDRQVLPQTRVGHTRQRGNRPTRSHRTRLSHSAEKAPSAAAQCVDVAVVQVGVVHSTRAGDDDTKTLKGLQFQIGDYLSVSISTRV